MSVLSSFVLVLLCELSTIPNLYIQIFKAFECFPFIFMVSSTNLSKAKITMKRGINGAGDQHKWRGISGAASVARH